MDKYSNILNLDSLINIHRFAYFKLIRQLIKEGEVSISEQHPDKVLAVKVQLFADGDLTVYISNPSGEFDQRTYEFLVGVYSKVHKKIKSLDALRRDIQRIGSLLTTGLAAFTSYQWADASIEHIAGMLGLGFVFPEVLVWGKKVYLWFSADG